MLPEESATSPAPDCQMEPSDPLGVRFNTLVCASELSLYPMSQPV